MYMKLPKKRLAEMLIQCNKVIDQSIKVVAVVEATLKK